MLFLIEYFYRLFQSRQWLRFASRSSVSHGLPRPHGPLKDLPYLLSPLGKSPYEVVALLNSSAGTAEAASDYYGYPKRVAADPDVDLVICGTRVDTHVRTTEGGIKAGKAVYIEWPS